MNEAHLHLAFNHFPIIGTIFGLGILLYGMITKSNTVKNVAYALFVVSAITAFFSMSTGEGAEELVENMPDVGRRIIHEHEELAEKLALVLYVLGVISILGLYANTKNHSKAKLISVIAFAIAVVGVVLAKNVGTTGGEVRHTEIRSDSTTTTEISHENKTKPDND